MYRRSEVVQQMIDWVEENLAVSPTLPEVSRCVGYSPWYCSVQFHEETGMTLKAYVSGRRLSRAAVEIRDSSRRILDIAADCGFSSQQALTRAFVLAFGCTPAAYRKRPGPMVLLSKKVVVFPWNYCEEEVSSLKDESFKQRVLFSGHTEEPECCCAEHKTSRLAERKVVINMEKSNLSAVTVQTLFVPTHQYLCVRDPQVQSYLPFWDNKDCDGICGVIDSLAHLAHPVLGAHTAGWFYEEGKKGYSYGLGLAAGYSGKIPEGFQVLEYPSSYYLVFSHPPFDFLKDCSSVMEKVENLAWNYDPAKKSLCWNEQQCQDYQLHRPEDLGYQVWRPVLTLG